MKPASCPRRFELAAISDGRMRGAARESFARHVTTCVECAHEQRALAALTEAVCALPGPARDALEIRRQRTHLLSAFDRELVRGGERRWSSVAYLGLAAALAVGVLSRSWLVRAPQPSAAEVALVHASSSAVWSRRSQGQLEHVWLEHGSLSIRVDHGRARGHKLIVVLPDGELEDIGTTFTVSAESGRTTRVSVQEGSVELRVRGQAVVAIGAGETWSPEPPPTASACATSDAKPEPVAPETPQPSAAATQHTPSASSQTHTQRSASATSRPQPSAAGAPRARRMTPSISTVAPATAAPSTPGAEFRAAMSVLEGGDNLGAATAFARFAAQHPSDARAEDAAYLRVIALHRHGAEVAAKQAAREYLQRYPAGFRRTELEKLAR